MIRHNMKAERARAGLTVAQAADRLNVHPNTLAAWENGTQEPLASNIVAMAHMYGVSAEYLLDLTGNRSEHMVATA